AAGGSDGCSVATLTRPPSRVVRGRAASRSRGPGTPRAAAFSGRRAVPTLPRGRAGAPSRGATSGSRSRRAAYGRPALRRAAGRRRWRGSTREGGRPRPGPSSVRRAGHEAAALQERPDGGRQPQPPRALDLARPRLPTDGHRVREAGVAVDVGVVVVEPDEL